MCARGIPSHARTASDTSVSTAASIAVKYPSRLTRNVVPTTRNSEADDHAVNWNSSNVFPSGQPLTARPRSTSPSV